MIGGRNNLVHLKVTEEGCETEKISQLAGRGGKTRTQHAKQLSNLIRC